MIDASVLDDYRWLLGADSRRWLARAAEDDREPVALATERSTTSRDGQVLAGANHASFWP